MTTSAVLSHRICARAAAFPSCAAAPAKAVAPTPMAAPSLMNFLRLAEKFSFSLAMLLPSQRLLSISRQVLEVAVVFVADKFHEFDIRQQMHFFGDRPRSGIGF